MPISIHKLRNLLIGQGYRCNLTGRPLTPQTAALDHVKPAIKGGLHVIENCQILHVQINSAKGTMDVEEFIEMCREVVRYQDAKARGEKLPPAPSGEPDETSDGTGYLFSSEE